MLSGGDSVAVPCAAHKVAGGAGTAYDVSDRSIELTEAVPGVLERRNPAGTGSVKENLHLVARCFGFLGRYEGVYEASHVGMGPGVGKYHDCNSCHMLSSSKGIVITRCCAAGQYALQPLDDRCSAQARRRMIIRSPDGA